MPDVKWIKIVTDIFDDEKILLIESMPENDSIIVIWFKLLCLAGKQNNGGVFILNDRLPYTDEMFATIFRRPVNTVRLALQTFEQFGMIEIINDTVTIPNWGKHQNIEGMQARKDYQREYMREYRKKQKAIACKDAVTEEKTNGKGLCKCLRNDDVSVLDIDKDIEREEDIVCGDKSPKQTAKRFTPPTIDEVRSYCKERHNNVDADRFVNYYTSNGWRVGKNPMKDWKAAVRTWERDSGYSSGAQKQQKPDVKISCSSIDDDDIKKIMNPYGVL